MDYLGRAFPAFQRCTERMQKRGPMFFLFGTAVAGIPFRGSIRGAVGYYIGRPASSLFGALYHSMPARHGGGRTATPRMQCIGFGARFLSDLSREVAARKVSAFAFELRGLRQRDLVPANGSYPKYKGHRESPPGLGAPISAVADRRGIPRHPVPSTVFKSPVPPSTSGSAIFTFHHPTSYEKSFNQHLKTHPTTFHPPLYSRRTYSSSTSSSEVNTPLLPQT